MLNLKIDNITYIKNMIEYERATQMEIVYLPNYWLLILLLPLVAAGIVLEKTYDANKAIGVYIVFMVSLLLLARYIYG